MDRNQENQIENAMAVVARLAHQLEHWDEQTSKESYSSIEQRLKQAEQYLQDLLDRL